MAAQQLDIFSQPRPAPKPKFGGRTYEPKRDKARLSSALARVYSLMSDERWRTLREIADLAGCSEAGASARLRDLRKERNQAQFPVVDVQLRRGESDGVYEYRILVR